ncbi:MAG: methyltransferase domain-containing protein [bacterium]
MNQTIKTYSQIYQEYAASNMHFKQIQPKLKKFVKLLNGKKVLDIGCADGRDTAAFQKLGLEVTGIDLTPEFIKLAKQNHTECNFVVMDMLKLDFAPESFSGIWASASLLHIPKKEALQSLQGFYRVLDSKGILYFSVMKGDFDGERENKHNHWGPRHFADYQQAEIEELLNETNFQKIEITSNKVSWRPTFLHVFARKNGERISS